MDEKEQPQPNSEETPEVYTIKKDLTGWRFNRRVFLAAAGTTAAAAAVASCGTPEPVVIMVTETASPVPPTQTLIPAPTQGSEQAAQPTNTEPPPAAPTATQPPPVEPGQPTVTEAPTLTSTPEQPRAEFVKDVTVPDGTNMRPQQAFTKTWRYRNSGTVPWGEGVKLVFVSGTFSGYQSNQMGGPDAVNVTNAAPGDNVDVSVNMVAPNAPGRYRGYWRLQLANGTWLENNHYVEIVVPAPATATRPPTAVPTTPSCDCVGHTGCGCDGDCGCDKDCGCDGDCGCDRDSGGHYWHPN